MSDTVDTPPSNTDQRSGRRLSTRLHALTRWLHIYMSLFGLAATLFFGVTGLTLNHPDWFDTGYEAIREESGEIEKSLLENVNGQPQSLEIVEFARQEHNITAPLKDLLVDDYQITLAFAGPAYTADLRIDREFATYEFTEVQLGLIPIINDLHKGRDTGPVWSAVIDVSAMLLVLISVSGSILLCWLKRRWRNGLLTIIGGFVVTILLMWLVVV